LANISNIIVAQRAYLGRKPDAGSTGRLAEAKRLTSLLHSHNGFSFGRIGDYDVGFLLRADEAVATYDAADRKISGTGTGGSPGLQPTQVMRFRATLKRVSYLDFHERLWKDNALLDQLQLDRSPEAFRNPNRETSYILPTWLEHEFRGFCSGRRVLFCGAEAPVLEVLLRRPEFHECARDFWPTDCRAYFLRPREDGRNLGANLDLIKTDLRTAIQRWQIDTMFLSLGGAAKILCCELAEELGVRAIDFGASLRSLTYSGSDGNRATRSTHTVFLFRVPFSLYMDALEEAFQGLASEELLAKAHAQLLLEVQEKEVGWSHSAWEYDFGLQDQALFREGFREYKRRYRNLFERSTSTRKERAGFLHFCGTHRLTVEGIWFLRWFKFKGYLRAPLDNLPRMAPVISCFIG
jgi:hypothetical protein